MRTQRRKIRTVDAKKSLSIVTKELEKKSRDHYGIAAAKLLAELPSNTERQLQFARLLGVIVKDPLSDEIRIDPKTSRTGAKLGLRWKPIDTWNVAANKSWQAQFLRAFAREAMKNDGLRTTARASIDSYIQHEFMTEARLSSAFLKALHRRLCASAKSSSPVKEAIDQARANGAQLVTPDAATIQVGVATVVAVSLSPFVPAALAATALPLLGGVALLLTQIGVDGFCNWMTELERRDTLRAEEQRTELASKTGATKRRTGSRRVTSSSRKSPARLRSP